MISPEVIRTHLRYTAWASRTLVEAAAKLTPEELNRDFGTADKSVLGTLTHIFAADRMWLSRINPPQRQTFLEPRDFDIAVLDREWPAIGKAWLKWADGLVEADTTRGVIFRDLKGTTHTQPLWQIVLHVVNHGTHHRGQVSGFLRAMGHAPAQLDLTYYYRNLQG